MTFLGIEIGGTKLQIGLGMGDGTITHLVRHHVDPSRRAEGIREQIVRAVRALNTEVAAVGFGFGGPVDADRGIATLSHQVEGWGGFPLADWAREVLEIPVVAVSNDADAAALGEALFGAGRGLSPILYVNSGSGIGGGLVIEGKIYRGSGVGAIEIGHLWIEAPSEVGGEQVHGRLEDLASGWAIAKAAKRAVDASRHPDDPGLLTILTGGDSSLITAEIVARAARGGDIEAIRIFDRATAAMGTALAQAVTLLAPRRVILGGGVSLLEESLWLDPIRRRLEPRAFPPFRGTFDVVTARLGQDVVVHGVLALARDRFAQ